MAHELHRLEGAVTLELRHDHVVVKVERGARLGLHRTKWAVVWLSAPTALMSSTKRFETDAKAAVAPGRASAAAFSRLGQRDDLARNRVGGGREHLLEVLVKRVVVLLEEVGELYVAREVAHRSGLGLGKG